jgi:predicted transport protein
MKAVDRPFTRIINGTTQFVIPVFQRDYSWTENHCDRLWKDVLQVGRDQGERKHFLGSVVYISTGDTSAGFTRWLLIDGQQRLTTLTLLLIALRDHIQEVGWRGTDNGPRANQIDAYFLKNIEEEGDRVHKVILRRRDRETLDALIDRAPSPIEESERVKENYDFFREKLRTESECDPDLVYIGIGRLMVVDVMLDRGADDPQLVFESLNSTGMDLSQSDLIRNFVLMRLPEKQQTRLYESYWNKLERLFYGSERAFDSFMRDYLALRTHASKQERADEIYFAFRREFGSIGADIEKLERLLQELLRSARYHAAFSMGADADPPLQEPLLQLRRLVEVPGTLVMRLFECYELDRTLPLDEFKAALHLLASYVFRRAICGEQTRGYWQIFANLAYKIAPQRPMESLKVGLATLPDAYAFPEDRSFEQALQEEDIYHKRVCFDLLEGLENFDTNERTDTSKYSIEHIMPQNERLTTAWKGMLGPDWKEVQREWLHRLGNLTLTGYNSSYSDRPFADKKKMRGGFNESAVRLNRYVREQSAWTAKEMEHRGQELARKAIKVWPSLSVDRQLVQKAREADIRSRAQKRDISKVPMSPAAKHLFDLLRPRILDVDSNIIELAEALSVSYHGPVFFLEVLPRKNRLCLLFALDYNEVVDPDDEVKDATQRAFIWNAQHDGGVYVLVNAEDDIERVIPILHQAYDRSRS